MAPRPARRVECCGDEGLGYSASLAGVRAMRTVVALCGKRCVGKDTLAAALEAATREVDRPLLRLAFADEAKRAFARHHNATVSPSSDPDSRVDGERLITDRTYKERWRAQLSAYVTHAIKEDPGVFCRHLIASLERAAPAAVLLVTDLRLLSDLAQLKQHFRVHVVRIERSDQLRQQSGWRYTPGVDDHPTETELDDAKLWSEVVRNEGTVEALNAQARALLARIPPGAA